MSYMPCPAPSQFVITDEVYRLRYNCLQPPVTSSFLGPHIHVAMWDDDDDGTAFEMVI
jgi:hypothetical protein